MGRSILQEAKKLLEKCRQGEAIENDWEHLERLLYTFSHNELGTGLQELEKLKHQTLVRDGTLSLKRLRGEVSEWIYFEVMPEDGVHYSVEQDIAQHIEHIVAQGVTYAELGASLEDVRKIEEYAGEYELIMIHEELSSGKKWELTESRKSAVEKGRHYILHVVGDPELTRPEKKELLALAYVIAELRAVEEGRYRVAINGPKQQGNKEATPYTHIHIICPAEDDELPRLTEKK